MKRKSFKKILAGVCALTLTATSIPFSMQTEAKETPSDKSGLRLWYDEPASKGTNILSGGSFGTTPEDNTWQQQTLPIGNSFMGANVYGEIGKERLTFNQKTLWNGGPSTQRPNYQGGNKINADNGKKMSDVYKEIIELYKKGEDARANQLAAKLIGEEAGYGAYQSWGDIYVDFKFDESKAKNYVRDLDIENAVASVDFDYNSTKMHREYFVSYPDNVMAMKFTANGNEKLNFDISFPIDNAENVVNRKLGKDVQTTVKDNTITVAGHMQDNQLKLNGKVKVETKNGDIQTKDGDKLQVSNASEVIVYVSADTDYKNDYPKYRTGETEEQLNSSVQKVIDKASQKGYEKVKEDHITDYSKIFSRVQLDLGQNVPSKTTDILLNDYKAKKNTEAENRALEVLLFQYGRYLTIASSREGDLPANLQGVWQNRVGDANRVPWGSDYHMNVNLQMNYWPTYSTNMAECATPLVDYINSLVEPGKVTAKTYFGVEKGGFTAHTQNTPFGWTCPGWNFSWGWSPAALPWILQNCWEYYEYTGDVKYMEEHIYPMLKEAALLYDQILIEDKKTGRLVSAPAYSPEHGPVTAGNTYEQSLIWQLYEDVSTAAEILGKDEAKVKEWRERQAKLKPIEIGDSGQIKEWYTETTLGSMGSKGHRHMSHLLGLFPGDLISVDNADYMDAAIVSLKERGDTSTGWGMGQRINAWARTGNGNQAHKLIQNLFRDGIYPNLWDSHAPFQIDGNFGMTSGVAEMLLQSNMGYINMLPSLPDVWANGNVKGLVARGNFEVNMKWANKNVTEATILSKNGGKATVQVKNASLATVLDESGKVVEIKPISADRISFDTKKGQKYIIKNIPAGVEIPTGLIAERIDANNVNLTWDEAKAEGRTFNVYRKVENGDVQLIESNIKTNSYKDITADKKLGEMKYQITAVVAGQESKKTEFVLVNDMSDMAGMIDDRDNRVKYHGAWANWDEAVNYNGTIKYLETPKGGETASLTFVGTGIEVVTCTNNDRGMLEVLIDGKTQGEVDTYSATTERQKVIFTKKDLSKTPEKHTITLKVLNKSSQGEGKRTKVELDAFNVLDSTSVKPSAVQVSTVSGITTVGKANSTIQMQAEVSPKEVKDKSVMWTSSDDSIATVNEAGLVTIKDKNGNVKIKAVSKVDKTKSGEKTLKVAIKKSNEVQETIVEDGTKTGNQGTRNDQITWHGNWSTWAGETKHHGGTKTETGNGADSIGSYFEYKFTGTGIEVYSHKNTTQGSFTIYLDNKVVEETASLDGNDVAQSLVYSNKELSNGEHTIKCVVKARNGKNQANLDYLKVFSSVENIKVDKSRLQDTIEEASKFSEVAYTQEKWTAFKKVYDDAVKVMNKDDATQDEVNKAQKDLETAITTLGKAQAPVVKDEKGKAILVESKLVALEWDAVRGATSYEIVDTEHNVKEEATDTFVKVKALQPGATYNFKIYAVNEGGKSSKAIEVNNVTTIDPNADNTLPSVTDIVKTVSGKDSVKLTWKAPATIEVAGYIVYVDGVKKGTTDKEEFILAGLEKDKIYVVKIIAFDKKGHQSLPAQFAFAFSEEKEEQVIVSVTEPESLTVEKGTAFDKLNLPKTVMVQLESGLDKELPVKWDKGDYNSDENETYTLHGTLELKDGVINPNDVSATIKVIVKSETITPPNPDGNGDNNGGNNNGGNHNNGNHDGNNSGNNNGTVNGNGSQNSNQNSSVKTGDTAPIVLWGIVGLCAITGIGIVIRRRKMR
ncbi:glycosyl hydrolase family 95 catalytic domain-containing protein [Faecalimonas sp.]